MTSFNILEPNLNLKKPYFVEASAGCGKTFSIEHVVCRLILEDFKHFDLEKILVLTFTREACKELKARVRNCLEKTLLLIEKDISSCHEYVQKACAKNQSQCEDALKAALTQIDSASIYTIHKFCFLKLQNYPLDAQIKWNEAEQEAEPVSLHTYAHWVKIYLSTQLEHSGLFKFQISLLFKYFQHDFDSFLKAIIFNLMKEVEIDFDLSFEEKIKALKKKIELFKAQKKLSVLKLKGQFLEFASFFKGAVDRDKRVHGQVLQSLSKSFSLFELKNIDQALFHWPNFMSIFNSSNLKANFSKNAAVQKWVASIFGDIENKIYPLINELTVKENLLAKLCQDCQKFIYYYFDKSSILTPNNLLLKFEKILEVSSIAEKINAEYSAIVVDEFQDTDPVQWKILSTIFLKDKARHKPIFLVGDPKQSIYGFRQADIYTYLSAAKHLKLDEVSTLSTNYRSQSALIEALNALFSYQNKKWLAIPKLNSHLHFSPVKSCDNVSPIDFKDTKSSLHAIFFKDSEKGLCPSNKLEESILFPYIAREIFELRQKTQLPYSAFSILIRDRYQGSRLKNFLKKHKLPFIATRAETMQGSYVVKAFFEVFQATLFYKNKKYVNQLRLSSLLKISFWQFEEKKTELVYFLMKLNDKLINEGFFAFYQMLTQDTTLFSPSLMEQILSDPEGPYFYVELEQLKELVLEEELQGKSPFQILSFLQELGSENSFPDRLAPLRQNFQEDGIQILTMHMSKGLEFEVVFALGLINESNVKEDFIYDREQNVLRPRISLTPLEQQKYVEEQDAEKMRQLYVVMTRAKQRLYLFVPMKELSSPTLHSSPINSFLYHLDLPSEQLRKWIESQKHISYSTCFEKIDLKIDHKNEKLSLVAPTKFKRKILSGSKLSYTSLSHKQTLSIKDLQAPHDFQVDCPSLHNLPAGAEIGLLFHQIFEEINFSENDISLQNYFHNSPYLPWKKVIEDVVNKVLNASFVTHEPSFTLSLLNPDAQLKEISFYYPIIGDEKLDNLSSLDGLSGVVDLVFVWNNKYYILDYKTNWLGPDSSSYLNLNQVMVENNYDLQAKIYYNALKKYLASRNIALCQKNFGGVYYWFIRGIEAENAGILKFEI